MAKRNAFTLAEVLITLGIIGVVAAMTMPTLLTNTQQQQFRAQLKKSMTVLAQAAAVNLAIDDYDASTALAGNTAGSDTLYALYKNRTNVISTSTSDISNYYTLYYNDGSSFSIPTNVGNCKFVATAKSGNTAAVNDPFGAMGDAAPTATTKNGMCVGIIDVNGKKAPNANAACDTGTSGRAKTAKTSACTVKGKVYDRFHVFIDGSNLYPASNAVEAFYQNRK